MWEDAVGGAKSIMDYYYDSAFLKFDATTPEGKKEISKAVLPGIKRLPNKIEQSHWIQKLSGDMNIKEEIITDELNKISLHQHRGMTPVQEKVESKLTEPKI